LFFYPLTLFSQAAQRPKISLAKALLTATARLNLLAPATGHFSDFIYAADPEQELALADPAPVIPTMAKAQGNIRSSRRFIFMSFLL
jgi:hypothetical protein